MLPAENMGNKESATSPHPDRSMISKLTFWYIPFCFLFPLPNQMYILFLHLVKVILSMTFCYPSKKKLILCHKYFRMVIILRGPHF